MMERRQCQNGGRGGRRCRIKQDRERYFVEERRQMFERKRKSEKNPKS